MKVLQTTTKNKTKIELKQYNENLFRVEETEDGKKLYKIISVGKTLQEVRPAYDKRISSL